MTTQSVYGETVARSLAGRFGEVHLLHAGENGLVLSCRDPSADDARRALRVAYPHDGDEAHALRFRRLTELGGLVTHPHVVQQHGVESVAELEVAVMELAGPLRVDHLITAPRPTTVHRILAVLRELAAALDALHAARIVHGALRPSRVLLDASGHVKLTGMMLRTGEHAPHAALRPGAVGDPAYMAPEQWEAATPTPAMDVYAAGVIAYELYTAERRVERADSTVSVLPLAVPLQRHLRPDLPLAVNEVLRRATNADPALRYATVSAFVEALAEPHTPVSGAEVIAPPPPTSGWPMGRLVLLGVLVMVLLALIW